MCGLLKYAVLIIARVRAGESRLYPLIVAHARRVKKAACSQLNFAELVRAIMPQGMAPPDRNVQEKFDDRKILRSAIKTATRERLVTVLLELLDNADEAAASLLESRLLTTKGSVRSKR